MPPKTLFFKRQKTNANERDFVLLYYKRAALFKKKAAL